MYSFDASGKIARGFDVPEPTIKAGSVSLGLLSLVSKLFKALGIGAKE